MVSFVNFGRIASICVGFRIGTLHGYFFSPRLLAKFELPARISNKTCLKLYGFKLIFEKHFCLKDRPFVFQ